MHFSVPCPSHGQVSVGIGDIASVVIREDDMVDVVFECPECGTHIHVTAQVPRVLLASLEETMVLDHATGERRIRLVGDTPRDLFAVEAAEFVAADTAETERIDAYCEYFRRQLDTVSTVEAILREIDAG